MNHELLVPFDGHKLVLIDYCGEPYVAMRPIVEAMGLNWKGQYVKISQRFHTCVEEISTQLPGDDQRRKVVCLPLKKLFGWLMTIMPNKLKPELRDKIILFQIKTRLN